ncbi:MAG: hypothetical protein CME04_02100 [Gemmatimonadaceae bacterium]|nr:hypothetical protein [Gemmatimonadaceae bacterium]
MARRRWRVVTGLCAVGFYLASTAAADAGGTITGTVSVSLPQRGERPPRYYRGAYRASHTYEAPSAPVQSVVVYLEDLPTLGDGWTIPAEPALMRQHHDRFVPRVLPVLRGRTVSFPNDDNYYHNVFSVVAGDRFDLGRFGQGDTRLQVFADPAVVVVRCEIHPGMKAFILVRQNPAFTVPDASGHFQLRDVPAGTWSLVAWHPTRANLRRTVTATDGKSATLELSF